MRQNVFILCVVVFIMILLIAKLTEREHMDITNKPKVIKSLTRQAFRWYFASMQDSNPIVKGLHADYAVAYADILKQVATREEIMETTHIDIDEFINSANAQQDAYIVEIAQLCPDLIPKDPQYQKYIRSTI